MMLIERNNANTVYSFDMLFYGSLFKSEAGQSNTAY